MEQRVNNAVLRSVKFVRIAAILALPSTVKLSRNLFSSPVRSLALPDLEYAVAEYLGRVSLVAFAIAVGYDPNLGNDHDKEDLILEDVPQVSHDGRSIHSGLWPVPGLMSRLILGPAPASTVRRVQRHDLHKNNDEPSALVGDYTPIHELHYHKLFSDAIRKGHHNEELPNLPMDDGHNRNNEPSIQSGSCASSSLRASSETSITSKIPGMLAEAWALCIKHISSYRI